MALKPHEPPFKKAFKESRTIVLAAFLLAIAFNFFAANRIPWIREPKPLDMADSSDLFATPVQEPVDTTPTPGDEIPIDSQIVNQDSIDAWKRDSAKKDQKRIADSVKKAQQDASNVDVAASGEVKGITIAQAKQIFDRKNAQFIDARRSDQFAEGHIPGAINAYGQDIGSAIPTLMGIPRDKLVVVYCDGGLCELSHELADQLVGPQFGFQRVVIFTGGWEEWSKANYPVQQ